MVENIAHIRTLLPVSKETLEVFTALCDSVETDVVTQCLSSDNPQATMGPEAEGMIKRGLGFVSRMLYTTMAYGAQQIINDELTWAKIRLPVNGVSIAMVQDNIERFVRALEERMQPYLKMIIEIQRSIVEEAGGNRAG